MSTEPKDQSKRKLQIQILESSIAKYNAAIKTTELILQQQRENQVHRLAELRHQKMLLKWHEDKTKPA